MQHYRHADWLGSVRLVSTPSRTVSGDTAYAPFGFAYAQSGSPALSFTGQNQDTAANLYDFMYREYGIQGRWPSPDPLDTGAFNLADPQTLDLYAYVRNSPMSLTDPTGMLNTPAYEQASTWTTWDEFDLLNMAMGGSNYPGCPYGDCSAAYAAQIAGTVTDAINSMNELSQQAMLSNLPLLQPSRTTPLTPAEQKCEPVIRSAGNSKFGTSFTANNVLEPFRYSTAGPLATDTVNLNIAAGSQISSVAPGRYPLHWWTYVSGIGPTLHVPIGPGGLDGGLTIRYGQNNDFTMHIDNAYPGWNPLGDLFHGLMDILGIGRNPCP